MSDTSNTVPEQLTELCQQIDAVLAADDPDSDQLNQLVSQRDQLIQQHLSQLSGEDKHRFADAQLTYNQTLQDKVTALFSATERQLGALMKGRRAIKKYKKS